nr:MAG TPA: hypothetical protein [Caudoviricetes sp.]
MDRRVSIQYAGSALIPKAFLSFGSTSMVLICAKKLQST